MSTAIKEMGRVERVNLERLVHILKGLSVAELDTLELLLDEEAFWSINQSLKELEGGKGIPIIKDKNRIEIVLVKTRESFYQILRRIVY